MLIISAGVVMNVILGMACFVAAYLHGVQEKPATVGWMESGGAAWRAGMHTNDHMIRIDSRSNPFFNDIRPIVMSTLKGETVEIEVRASGREDSDISPWNHSRTRVCTSRRSGSPRRSRLTLLSLKKKSVQPVIPGSPAAEAKNPGFEPGDRIVGMTAPESGEVTPLRLDPKEPARGPDFNDYYERLAMLGWQADHLPGRA